MFDAPQDWRSAIFYTRRSEPSVFLVRGRLDDISEEEARSLVAARADAPERVLPGLIGWDARAERIDQTRMAFHIGEGYSVRMPSPAPEGGAGCISVGSRDLDVSFLETVAGAYAGLRAELEDPENDPSWKVETSRTYYGRRNETVPLEWLGPLRETPQHMARRLLVFKPQQRLRLVTVEVSEKNPSYGEEPRKLTLSHHFGQLGQYLYSGVSHEGTGSRSHPVELDDDLRQHLVVDGALYPDSPLILARHVYEGVEVNLPMLVGRGVAGHAGATKSAVPMTVPDAHIPLWEGPPVGVDGETPGPPQPFSGAVALTRPDVLRPR